MSDKILAIVAATVIPCTALLNPPAAVAQMPDNVLVNRVSARLKNQLHNGGIIGVGRDVQRCYDDAGTSKSAAPKIRECMLYDAAAYRLDKGMQAAFTMRGMDSSDHKYFSDKPFNMRLIFYGGIAFSGNDADANRYLVTPSFDVMTRAVQ